MNDNSIIFIGVDTHKTFSQVAVLQDNRGATPQALGKIQKLIQPTSSILAA